MTIDQARAEKRVDAEWQRRVAAKRFRRQLVDLLRAELSLISSQPIKKILPPERARRIVRDLAPQALSDQALADTAVAVQRMLVKQLRATRQSPADLLGADISTMLERLFDEDLLPAEVGEDLIEYILRQEFVRNLLTEVVHTSIVSFYKRVNPIFGGLATAVLDDQIRSFVSMFMPMIQEQAVRFAVGKRNQAFARELARSLSLHLLATPIAQLVPTQSPRQRQRVEALVREAAAHRTLRSQSHRFAALVWDAIYEAIRERRVSDVIDLEQLATPLAESGAELLAATLARPALRDLLRSEMMAAEKPSVARVRQAAARTARSRSRGTK